jgi:hypothetical protein
MAEGFLVSDHLRSDDLKNINISLWQAGSDVYFGSTPEWRIPESAVLRGIAHPSYDVETLLGCATSWPVTMEGDPGRLGRTHGVPCGLPPMAEW